MYRADRRRLVEDDLGIARFVATALRAQAYVVDILATGEHALYQAAINTYDVIILT
jgi:DNA-binding response OmpR family regulator